jgi:hypothetical protein
VQVGALVRAADVVGGEQVLDLLPGLWIDQWLVGAGVDGAFVVDLALVVGVVEDVMQSADCEGLSGWAALSVRGR